MKEYTAITGASSGIGKEYAKQLAKTKRNLILISKSKVKLLEVKKELSKNKIDIKIIISDLSKEEEIKKLEGKLSKLNITQLINSAGFGNPHMFHESDINVSKDMINIHVTASTALSRAVIPNMISKKNASIINVSSLAAYARSSRSNAIYNSTKMYIIIFSKILQDEFKKKGYNIKVQALCPGIVSTNFRNRKEYNKINKRIPRWLVMPSDAVVRWSLRKLNNNCVVCVPGNRYKIIYPFLKYFL